MHISTHLISTAFDAVPLKTVQPHAHAKKNKTIIIMILKKIV